ncbi:hypothetical protein ILUMI_04422 [Ignelater luminosus]|uniref:ATP-dependent RNA helicase n=1 Tax=Ignelater luminosus TaxID=2038154 RepID=A0A8K0D9Q8_IGNLU|nr:hypothetical protein ILUMI_04422 [Ignelater luminosus]
MDLFVVNRHDEDKQKDVEINEEANIQRVLKRIEKRKAARSRQKELEKKKQTAIARTREERQRKRERKAKIVPIPTGKDEFIDENIKETTAEETVSKDHESSRKTKTKKKAKLDSLKVEGFTVLGGESFDRKAKVKRVLPKWLSNPTVISVNLQDLRTKVSSMKVLDKDLRKKLKANRVKYLFPVQAEVIPWLIQADKHSNIILPRDICVSAPTGSGKTLAFVLPVIQALKAYHLKRIRALVILPTQDLALQVFQTFKRYAQGTHIDISLITGKNPFAMEQKQLVSENEAFRYLSKTDILVCTAGRLVDHLKETKGFDLTHLKYLIIDEADRVLDNVQNDWLYHLERHMFKTEQNMQAAKILNFFTLKNYRPPQKLLFSATLSQDPEKLQKLSLFQPKLFTSIVETGTSDLPISHGENTGDTFIGKYTTPKELTERYIECSEDLKPLVLYEFIKQEKLTKTMIFTHSVESAHRLAILLQALFKNKLKIEEVSSQLEGNRRNTLIGSFSKGNIDVIVCTDALARGMDLIDVQCVISYTAPKYLKTYIHRAGRTARAGEQGLAVTLLDKTRLNKFMNLLQQAGKNALQEIKISEEGLESLGEQYREALGNLKKAVSKEEEESLRKMKSAKGRGKKRKFKSAKTNRKKKKIEKQIRRLERNARQLKPIEECEIPLTLIDNRKERERSLPALSNEVMQQRITLEKQWAHYKHKEHLADLQMLDRIVYSQQKALDELRKESEELYQEAIQIDPTFLPLKMEGPAETTAIKDYDSPDGVYDDISKKWN